MHKNIMYVCSVVIVIAAIALLILINTEKPLNTIALPVEDTSLDMTTVRIKNVDLYDQDKILNGAIFRITDQTKNDSLDTRDVTISEETYLDLPYGNYTIELLSPATDYMPSNVIKSFILSKDSIEPFDIVIKSELKPTLDANINNKSSDLLPTTYSIFETDSPSKNPQTNDDFFKHSFFVLIVCAINLLLINTFFYLKKLR